MKYLPCVATSFTGTPISWAINPTMLNMTKPAKKLVALFPNVITKESLENNGNKNNQIYVWKKMLIIATIHNYNQKIFSKGKLNTLHLQFYTIKT